MEAEWLEMFRNIQRSTEDMYPGLSLNEFLNTTLTHFKDDGSSSSGSGGGPGGGGPKTDTSGYINYGKKEGNETAVIKVANGEHPGKTFTTTVGQKDIGAH